MGDIGAARGSEASAGAGALASWIPEIVDELVRKFDPARVILYGSVARGEAGPDSDIDLMVVLDAIDYEERHTLAAQMRRSVTDRVPIDLRVTDERECRRRCDVIGSMHYWPLREGVVVYERTA